MSARRTRGWILAGGALLACAGCGFKGPLYLPERNATVVTHPAPAAPPTGPTQEPGKKKPEKPQPSQPPGGSSPPAQ